MQPGGIDVANFLGEMQSKEEGSAARSFRVHAPTPGRPTFARDEGFRRVLNREVRGYFEEMGRSRHADRGVYLKAAVMLAWFAGSYLLLVFVVTAWWQALLASLSLSLAAAGVGFNVQHDANHGATSKRKKVNHLFGLTLDLLGGSSYVWRSKHNIFHHTFTNLDGADSDIDLGPLARLAPAQPRRRWHRVQHYYLWPLYGFLVPVWHFYHDFACVLSGRIGRHRLPRPRGWLLVEMIGGKLLLFAYALVLPMLFHPWWLVLLFYGLTSMMTGLVLAVVFQMAHCVEEACFPNPPAQSRRVPSAWSVHQVQTTVDFVRGNRLLTWYLGGLNFQIEHHLFPKICHVHYPHIAPIVESVCRDFGLRYASHEEFSGALSSHFRWLRRMGRALPGTRTPGEPTPSAG